MYSLWAGWKLACTTTLPWEVKEGAKPCPSTMGLNNFSHPRSDPVVITMPINETGDKILLGRSVSVFGALQVLSQLSDTRPGELEITLLFRSLGLRGTRRGVRRLCKARVVGRSWSQGLGYQVSFQSAVGKQTYTSSMDHEPRLFTIGSPCAAFPSEPHGRVPRHG